MNLVQYNQKDMKKANVYMYDKLTGILTEDENGFHFEYDPSYLKYDLCPAYDLVASELVVEGDDEDLALNLNGKKKKIKRKDFENAMARAGLDQKVIENIFKKYKKLLPKWNQFISDSFLPEKMKDEYITLIKRKAIQIEL